MANRNMHSGDPDLPRSHGRFRIVGQYDRSCPVGALTSKPFRYTARSWELQRRKSVSPHDSVGANLVVQVWHDTGCDAFCPAKTRRSTNAGFRQGRFAPIPLNSDERLTKPMVKQGGQWREVDWNVALDYVAHGLGADVAREHGGDAWRRLAPANATVEESPPWARFAGPGQFRQHRFPSCARRISAPTATPAPWLGLAGRDQGSRCRPGGRILPAQGSSADRPASAPGGQNSPRSA